MRRLVNVKRFSRVNIPYGKRTRVASANVPDSSHYSTDPPHFETGRNSPGNSAWELHHSDPIVDFVNMLSLLLHIQKKSFSVQRFFQHFATHQLRCHAMWNHM